MLDPRDNEARSYLEFVDVLRPHGAASKQDARFPGGASFSAS
jgi:hypothetical protein